MYDAFEWDPEKDRANEAKHGVTFAEARTAIVDPFVVLSPDDQHSLGEHRYSAIGMSHAGRLLIVVYTERGDRVRIISARRATRREVRMYEG